MANPITNLRPNTSPIIQIPREVWEAGPASRAPALGRFAQPVEEIGAAAKNLARANPGLLRGLTRGIGGALAPSILIWGVEWAANWLLDNIIEPYRSWVPRQPSSASMGCRCTTRWRDFVSPLVGVFTETFEIPPNSPGISIAYFSGAPGLFRRPSFTTDFLEVRIAAIGLAGESNFFQLSSSYGVSRYEFLGIESFEVLGGGAPESPILLDPYAPPYPIPPGGFPAPSMPLAPRFPALPAATPIPGELQMATPLTRAADRSGFDFDWLPALNPRLNPQMPGLRLSFSPAGVAISALARELLPELAENIFDQILEEILEGGDCPSPCPPLDYERIRGLIFEELDEKFPPGRPNHLRSISRPAANSHTIALPPSPRRALISCTQRPSNTKMQPGGDSAPDVFFLGWYSVGFGGAAGDRHPIQFLSHSIPLEDGATVLAISGYQGIEFSVRVDYLEEI